MVIDDKGGEVMHKDSEKMTKGENFNIEDRGEIWESKGTNLDFEHTSRGSKLKNSINAFECAFHMFACIAQVLK